MAGLARIRIAALGLLVLLTVILSSGAQAQTRAEQEEYYKSWLKTAERAEEVIDTRRASNAAFESLREDIDGYRERFQTLRQANSDRIATLEAQVAALGPVPEDGDEPEDIANLRKRVNTQLSALRVPRLVSDEAWTHANGLISEIDRIIRERRTKALLERGPSPLNPVHWKPALRDLRDAATGVWNELRSEAAKASTREQTSQNLPLILILSAVALLLFGVGRRLCDRLGDWLRQFGGRGSGVWTFVVSLLQMLVPFLGVVLLTEAFFLTGIPGVRGTLLAEAIPAWALILLAWNWIGLRLFSGRIENDVIPVHDGQRREIRLLIEALAVMLVLRSAVSMVEQIENLSAATRAVLGFPLVTVTALILGRLHRIALRVRSEAGDGETGLAAGAGRIIRMVRGLGFLLAYLAPVLGAIGYINAAEAITFPVVLSMSVVAVVLILHRFFVDLYGWVSRTGEGARDSLLSVLAGFLLASLALPVLALIWGTRVADLTEMWQRFLEGFQVGGLQISPINFLQFALVFAVGYMITRLVQGSLRNSLLPKTRIDPGGQNAIVSGTGYVGVFLAALVAITMAGFDLSSIAIVAGALSVGIGFGLQTIVSNFVSGIILLVERPISKGDWIEVGGLMGYVRDISVRSTRIETFDRSDVIVPNSDLITGTVTNYTRGNTVGRVIVPVGVAYGTDPRKVEAILQEIAEKHPMVLANPAPYVVFQGFGADSLDFEIRAILRDVNWVLSVRSEMNYEIAARFEAEGIEIPFRQRDIWLRNPEALANVVAPSAPPAKPTTRPAPPDVSDLDGDPDAGDTT